MLSIDDQLDPKLAMAGAEQLLREGVHYILGPNIDTTAAVVVPLLRSGNAVNVAYAFGKYLYTPPQRNSILGMVASYQDDPIVFEYLRKNKGVKAVSFVARNEADSLNQRDEGVAGAWRTGLDRDLGLRDLPAGHDRLPPGDGAGAARRRRGRADRDGGPARRAGAAGRRHARPGRALRRGARGRAAHAASRCASWATRAWSAPRRGRTRATCARPGEAAEGFISLGGASPPEGRSPYMQDFAERYVQLAGEWNDEAGTKVYALEMILRTLQLAGPAAVDDVGAFLRGRPDLRHRRSLPEREAGAALRRREDLQPAAPDRRAARGRRVQGRRVQDPLRRHVE